MIAAASSEDEKKVLIEQPKELPQTTGVLTVNYLLGKKLTTKEFKSVSENSEGTSTG